MAWVLAIACFLIAGAVLLLLSPYAFAVASIIGLAWGGVALVRWARGRQERELMKKSLEPWAGTPFAGRNLTGAQVKAILAEASSTPITPAPKCPPSLQPLPWWRSRWSPLGWTAEAIAEREAPAKRRALGYDQ